MSTFLYVFFYGLSFFLIIGGWTQMRDAKFLNSLKDRHSFYEPKGDWAYTLGFIILIITSSVLLCS